MACVTNSKLVWRWEKLMREGEAESVKKQGQEAFEREGGWQDWDQHVVQRQMAFAEQRSIRLMKGGQNIENQRKMNGKKMWSLMKRNLVFVQQWECWRKEFKRWTQNPCVGRKVRWRRRGDIIISKGDEKGWRWDNGGWFFRTLLIKEQWMRDVGGKFPAW